MYNSDMIYSALGSQTALSYILSSAVSFEPLLGVNGLLNQAELPSIIILRKQITTHTGWFVRTEKQMQFSSCEVPESSHVLL